MSQLIKRITPALQSESFDPSKLITPAEGSLQGWRKTIKVTTPSGRKILITTGQGPMFEESSELESESESESFPLEPSKSLVITPPLPISSPRIVSDPVPDPRTYHSLM